MSAVPVQIALIDSTGRINANDLAAYAAALNQQIAQDVKPIWPHVNAHVQSYGTKFAPPATWHVTIQDTLDEPGALGYHTDDGHQPYALVQYDADWRITVDHEVLEMIVDPWGSQMHGGRLPASLETGFSRFGLKSARSRVRYLLEVCDPPENFTYEIGGLPMSDFLTPQWYRSDPGLQLKYSFTGACKAPREVAVGGYVSFCNDHNEWFQAFNHNGTLTVKSLGVFNKAKHGSLRAFTDEGARVYRAQLT